MPESLSERLEALTRATDDFVRALGTADAHADCIDEGNDTIRQETADYPNELYEARDAMVYAREGIRRARDWAVAARNALRCAQQAALDTQGRTR